VKYSDSSDTIPEHLRSLIILPESSFASHDTGDTKANNSSALLLFWLDWQISLRYFGVEASETNISGEHGHMLTFAHLLGLVLVIFA
jgi:hypothetical protein